MFERFTDRARKVMAMANQEAQRFNHEYIGTEHILLGLVREGSGVGATVLKNLDFDLRTIRLEVEKVVKSGPDMVTMGKLPFTPRTKKVVEYAIEEARSLGHNYVGTEHILMGLIREGDGTAAQVLHNVGCNLNDLREEILNLLGAGVEAEDEPPMIPERKPVVTVKAQDTFTADGALWLVFDARGVRAIARGPVAAFSWITSNVPVDSRVGFFVQAGKFQSSGILSTLGPKLIASFTSYYRWTDEQIVLFMNNPNGVPE